MSAKPQHNGLSADDRSKIRSAILSSREILETEFERQLERYGVYDDERVPLSKLGHLSLQDRETRREIDAALERELEATEDYQRAYRNYVREATKEYLNRYVGLKTIEARGLVTETLTSKAEYGNRSYLHYTVDEIAGELTDAPDDGLGVALDLAFQEIGAEIRILFEDTDYTAIEPEFTVRRDVFEELDELDDDVWATDEAIGWVYQYFGEKEREEIDDRIDEENYKVQDTDIATKTQLFTPRYIVEWMVDNSLGRLWLEMYGDETSIDDESNCFYLAPLEESLLNREPEDVRDITVLDPACGSGHMLFYAFDVLYEMYLEQGGILEKNIPREILKNNLYGIDIDPGAVQIAALALYTKAKERAPDVAIEQINVISADAVLVNGEKKQEVLNRVDTDLERRVLEQVWKSFENIREWGSLVRIEERIEEIIEEEREELESIQAQGQVRFTGDGEMTTQSSFISGREEISWETLKERLLERVRELAAEALEADDTVQEMFVSEVEKSVELMDYFVGDYDAVVTNPPYLGSGKMGDDLKQYIKDNYIGTRDTYAAFIQRCWEFAGEDNYATLVTPENYMFLYSYRKLRKKLIAEQQYIEGAHLSGYSFSMKDRPFTIPFVLRNRDPAGFRSSRFYRMTHEQEEYAHYEDKIKGLTSITKANRQGKDSDNVYEVDQNTFLEIGRTPFLYWFGGDVLDLFKNYPNLSELYEVAEGMGSGDDERFVRDWWEIDSELIDDKYNWIMKSGDDVEYYYSTTKTILWENDGEIVKEYDGSNIRNIELQGLPGLTFRNFGKHFNARIHKRNHLFNNKSPFIHVEDRNERYEILGYLCSSLARFIMNGLNPGINFNTGDGKRLPIKPQHKKSEQIGDLVKEGIEYREFIYSLDEIRWEFNGEALIQNYDDLQYSLELAKAKIQIIHGIIDEMIFDEYDIDESRRKHICSNLPKNLAKLPHLDRFDSIQLESSHQYQCQTISIGDDEYEDLVTKISNTSGQDIREISETLDISPYTVAMIRNEHDLYSRDEEREVAGRLLSYFIGSIFDRWDDYNSIEPESDGILIFDENNSSSITNQIRECIKIAFGEAHEWENNIEKMLNKDMTEWLRENFFRYHHTKEYRRRGQRTPIYWHLESDNGGFSCFLYYHALDADTLPKLRGQYVDAKLGTLENRLASLEREFEGATEEQQRDLRNEIEEIQNQLDDVEDFGERLDALIDDGFEPDFEAGIWENIQKIDKYDLLQTELDKL